jgi:hypothetical protein
VIGDLRVRPLEQVLELAHLQGLELVARHRLVARVPVRGLRCHRSLLFAEWASRFWAEAKLILSRTRRARPVCG